MQKSVCGIWAGVWLWLACSAGALAQPLDLFASDDPIARAEQELALRPHAQDEVWRQLSSRGLPLQSADPDSPDRVLATFLFQAEHDVTGVRLDSVLNAVEVSGRVEDYVRDFALPMSRIAQSDIWMRTVSVPSDAQAVYSFIVEREDGARRRSDPAGQRKLRGSAAEAVFIGPGARIDPAIRPVPFLLRPEPVAFSLDSEALGRTVFLQRVTLPGAGENAPVLVIWDSFLWGVRAPAWEIAQQLAQAGRIPPLHIVLIDQLDPRSADHEYADQVRFLIDELKPRLVVDGMSGRFVLAGASRRGLAGVIAGLQAPQAVESVISLSGSFYWAPEGEAPEWLARHVPAADTLAPRILLAVGTLETVETSTNQGHVMMATNEAMAAALDEAGYSVTLHRYAGGHDIAGWRGALAAGLEAVLSGS